jgi:hypothetical protein
MSPAGLRNRTDLMGDPDPDPAFFRMAAPDADRIQLGFEDQKLNKNLKLRKN